MDEKAKVEEEVERLKRAAVQKGVLDIGRLYLKKIRYYAIWYQSSREYVCELVTQVRDLGQTSEESWRGTNTTKSMQITLRGKDYILKFTEKPFETPDGESHVSGSVEVYVGEKKVAGIRVFRSYGRFSGGDHDWSVMDVEAFIDGDWLEDFRQLRDRIKEEDEERKKDNERRSDAEKTEKLKRDFGLS